LARKILLADDSVTAQNMGRKILADAGYEVVTVNNGSAALKKIAEIKPEMVILDVYMPGYSGLEVCQRLKDSAETARIPVLLTVGKLEPFKPDEAQRVRADGFIVKPFEASELLSALSKLEDKVVPRAEPSKPGRFARAIASVEEKNRNSQQIVGGDENGWKSRIGFPQEHSEPEEKAGDGAALYNPVNRDLRTVVEATAEKIGEEKFAAEKLGVDQFEDRRRQPQRLAEASVEVAAIAPQGMPQDVTPEEVAAIAAAAAQIQTFQAILKENEAAAQPVQELAEPMAEPQPEPQTTVQPDQQPQLKDEKQPEQLREAEAESLPVLVEQSAAALENSIPVPTEIPSAFSPDERHEEDLPVTMAVGVVEASASAVGSRWTAVAVALEGDEAGLSLEQEMQKAYAAFVAEEKASSVEETTTAVAQNGVAPLGQAVGELISQSVPEQVDLPAEVVQEPQPVSAIAKPSAEIESQPSMEPALALIAVDATEAPTITAALSEGTAFAPTEQGDWYSQAEPASMTAEPAAEITVPAAVVPAETLERPEPVAEISREHSAADTHGEISRPDVTGAEVTHFEEAREPVMQSEPVAEVHVESVPESHTALEMPAAQAEPGIGEILPSLHAVATTASVLEHEDSETVKSRAAAWENWRQTRDAGEAKTTSLEAVGEEPEAPLPAPPDSAAMAVAAGAEQISHEVPPPAAEASSDVASIVESLLADLRPRLMEEISRKMAGKK
jgi:two-component system, chemotaxis family, chemotaxis protein CheY